VAGGSGAVTTVVGVRRSETEDPKPQRKGGLIMDERELDNEPEPPTTNGWDAVRTLIRGLVLLAAIVLIAAVDRIIPWW
jgi:hypothetical protein